MFDNSDNTGKKLVCLINNNFKYHSIKGFSFDAYSLKGRQLNRFLASAHIEKVVF
jgi:hypothetical protein